MPFSPHGVSWVFYGVFFLAKVGQTGATPRTAGYSETNFAAAFHSPVSLFLVTSKKKDSKLN